MLSHFPQDPSREPNGLPVWSVGALCLAIGDALENRFAGLRVKGEISQVTHASSGHVYFTLKDASGQIRCAMFRQQARLLRQPLSEGKQVLVTGRLSVYSARGDLQLIVESVSVAGMGDLYERYLQLKSRLQEEGLFDEVHKRAIPRFPRKIGLVTSADAAAFHDVMTTLKSRAAHIPVVFSPSLVQGESAPVQLIRALQRLESIPDVDVVLVVRGGGSIEDLWAFNDERLVRHLATCPWPTLSGVGHETDFTLTDFVCDARAPTPTAAAQACAASRADCLEFLSLQEEALVRATQRWLDVAHQSVDRCEQELLAPKLRLNGLSAGLERCQQAMAQAMRLRAHTQMALIRPAQARMRSAIQTALSRARLVLDGHGARLVASHPDRVLQRGFVRLSGPGGSVVSSIEGLEPNEKVVAHFHDGRAEMQVLKTIRG